MKNRSLSHTPWIGLAAMLACAAFSADLAARTRTLGWLEWAWLEPGRVKVKTKLDTGARTSSIDAADIEPFERDGEPWVRFRVPLSKRPDDSDHGEDLVYELPVVREALIKEHDEPSVERYVVSIELCAGGRRFVTPVTLADRSRFNYPLLLGRLALQGRFLVDAADKFTARRACAAKAEDAPEP